MANKVYGIQTENFQELITKINEFNLTHDSFSTQIFPDFTEQSKRTWFAVIYYTPSKEEKPLNPKVTDAKPTSPSGSHNPLGSPKPLLPSRQKEEQGKPKSFFAHSSSPAPSNSKEEPVTEPQAKLLKKLKYDGDISKLTKKEASVLLDEYFKNQQGESY